MQDRTSKITAFGWCLVWLLVVLLALDLRSAGLFRGLRAGVVVHPDASKQVLALENFLQYRYTWYTGNVFYDGYPLFLNHVDEWLLRGIHPVHRGLAQHLDPGAAPPVLDRSTLFHWGRALRVLYGMVAFLAGLRLMRRCGLPSRARLAGAGLMALAPLPAVVTHAVTGDVGIDLFATLTMLCMAGLVTKPRALGLPLLGGVLVGFAFAAKYQGLLAGWVPGALLVLLAAAGQVSWKRFIGQTALSLAGLGAGILVAMPQWLTAPARTYADLVRHFLFVRTFNVPDEFLAKPWLERTATSLATNIPLVATSLGVTVCILAALALIPAGRAAWRAVRGRSRAPARALFLFSLFLFPVVTVLLSLLGKPSVEPFHFSYLQVPVCLAAAWVLARLWAAPARWRRVAGGALLAVALVELGTRSCGERFFWAHEDSWEIADSLGGNLVVPGQARPEKPFRDVRLEGPEPTLAVFRNAMVTGFGIPGGGFWRQVQQLPVPAVPFPANHYWIFGEGPVLPRNDRMFRVPNNACVRRCVVYETPPDRLRIGLRTGAWPARVTLRCGSLRRTLTLAANEQHVLTVPPRAYRTWRAHRPFGSGRFFVPLRVRAAVGNVWVTVLSNRDEWNLYRLFGGDPAGRPAAPPAVKPAAIEKELAQALYLRQVDYAGYRLTPEVPATLFTYQPLAAGVYELRCELTQPDPQSEFRLRVEDPVSGHVWADVSATPQPTEAGDHVVTAQFAKTFAPYQANVVLECRQGGGTLGICDLRPDPASINRDLFSDTGRAPAWAAHAPAGIRPVTPGPLHGVRFGRRFELLDVQVPPRTQAGAAWTGLSCAMQLRSHHVPQFTDYAVGVHLLDARGRPVGLTTFPLYAAVQAQRWAFPLTVRAPDGLPPGRYPVYLSVFDTQTGRALPVHVPRDRTTRHTDTLVQVGSTEYGSAEMTKGRPDA